MCRVKDAVLEGLAWDICMPYLDDIGIFSSGNGETLEERCEESFQLLLNRLDLVLERLIWAGLTCKMPKCTFFSVRAEYLGHIVSRDGLAMAASKIKAVSNIKKPLVARISAAATPRGPAEHSPLYITLSTHLIMAHQCRSPSAICQVSRSDSHMQMEKRAAEAPRGLLEGGAILLCAWVLV
jgi:hypothetical protein